MTVLTSESLVFHSNGWFIQKRGKWLLSFWMGYWIIDSLDSFKNVDSFSNETPPCCSETKQFCCGLDWNFISELEQKQSILYYKLWTLCLLHSQWRTSTPTTCLHADVSVSVLSKRTGSEGQLVRWDVSDLKQQRADRAVCVWHQSTVRVIRISKACRAICSL